MTTVPEWQDRFDGSRYDDDEPVHVYRVAQHGSSTAEVWVPERVWHRLQRLGSAYELHLLPLLDGSNDPVVLNRAQVDQLARELRFIGNLVDDPLVEACVGALVTLAAERSESASGDLVGIEFP